MALLILFMLFLISFAITAAQLELGFYNDSCPLAETLVREEVQKAFSDDSGIAPGLIRMHFHDCFVRGCDGSVLIDSTTTNVAEKDSIPNNSSLRGFQVIDSAKTRIEAICPAVVSCADILAFAARSSVEMTGGGYYDVPAGRRDGRVSLASEAVANLPSPDSNLSELTEAFASKGLTREEMVILSGAHTIGRSHCASFAKRLYNFSATSSQDPTLDPTYATELKQQCPNVNSTNPILVVPMDPPTPTTSDTSYYPRILVSRGLFTSDQTLLSRGATADVVEYAMDPLLWKQKFVAAMVNMGKIGFLTGNAGETRMNCRVINS